MRVRLGLVAHGEFISIITVVALTGAVVMRILGPMLPQCSALFDQFAAASFQLE